MPPQRPGPRERRALLVRLRGVDEVREARALEQELLTAPLERGWIKRKDGSDVAQVIVTVSWICAENDTRTTSCCAVVTVHSVKTALAAYAADAVQPTSISKYVVPVA